MQDSTDALLSTFLGVDGDSLSGADAELFGSVFLFTGKISLTAGVQTFDVFSDDGFDLVVGGDSVASFDGIRSIGAASNPSSGVFDAGEGGDFDFELLFYDGEVFEIGLSVLLNGSIVDDGVTMRDEPTPIPAPAPAALLVGALFFLARLRNRA